jgi:arylamine N-acetyltransferase
MVDVGFGGDGATKAIPLREGHITRNLGTQDIRLIRDFVPAQTVVDDPGRKLWIYQYRNGADKPWNSYYCFPELEFLPADFRVSNWFTSTCPEVAQTFTVLTIKFLRRSSAEAPGDEEICGKRMLVNGTVKENLGGKTHVVQECTREAERVEALEHWFGISLTNEEKLAIRGQTTELKE